MNDNIPEVPRMVICSYCHRGYCLSLEGYRKLMCLYKDIRSPARFLQGNQKGIKFPSPPQYFSGLEFLLKIQPLGATPGSIHTLTLLILL